MGLAAAVPAVTLGMIGGSIVDAVDRRRVVLIATSGQAVLSAALAAQAFLRPARLATAW